MNIKFLGGTHSLGGLTPSGETFEYVIPFQNRMGSDMLPDSLKGPSVRISKIMLGPPFELVSVEPSLPVDVQYKSKISFKLRIKTPSMAYNGPMSVDFGNDSAGNIAVNVHKVILRRGENSVELENSEIVATMQKSQVFRKEIQLYQIMSLNDTLKSVEVSAPFELVSVEPSLPVVADRKDSYMISVYIKAPQASYSGDMEIRLS